MNKQKNKYIKKQTNKGIYKQVKQNNTKKLKQEQQKNLIIYNKNQQQHKRKKWLRCWDNILTTQSDYYQGNK